MTTHQGYRVSITAEKLIQDRITRIIEDAGAVGYSFFEGGGKGHQDTHVGKRSAIVGEFAIVKTEVVVTERAMAEAIAERITDTVFNEHSGIVYIDNVDILRPKKFVKEG